ncbi:MAG TPA: DUF4192 domain-containing protein [Streptosporangiaceae bacterium]|nr:DUF4192 domain-containing protein [Streptosporangiaceae bacterium]
MRQTSTASDNTPQTTQTTQTTQTPRTPRAPRAAQPATAIRASSPPDLLAVVPHLLGFVPDLSLVVIGSAPPRDRIRVTLRYDLPDPPDADLAADIAAHAAGVLGAQRLPAALAVGYGPEALVAPVAGAFLDAARLAGITLHDVLRVENGRYWSYRCGNEACCPADGVPFDGSAHPVSAVMDAAGMRVLPGRAAVAGRIAPLDGAAAASMRGATRRAEQHAAALLGKVRKSGRTGAARQLIAAEGLNAVGSMIAAYRAGDRSASDYEIAWLTVALRDLRVRDDAWARMDPAHAEAHLRLWLDVTRRAQPGRVSAPAALLAFVAWQSGDGALANVALDRSLADDPRYSMALLLRQVIAAGAPPSLARLPMTPEEVAASYAGLGDGDDDEL